MKIIFECEEHESVISPLMIANAMVNTPMSLDDIKELSAYLNIYADYQGRTRYSPSHAIEGSNR